MKSDNIEFTVVMPSYNNGNYMPRALDSILMQKRSFELKIIITDDCSTDNSKEVMELYKSKYPDIITTLYSDKNQRLFSNQLKAMELMNTEYFCVLDPDDYWTDVHFLEKAVHFLENNKEFTIYSSNAEKVYTDKYIGKKGEMFIKLDADEATYTYNDYLNNKAHIMTTVGCVYRNVIFKGVGKDSIPEKYYSLKGTIYEEYFRAESARNLMHLQEGKIYFKNESIGCYQINGKGLSSSLTYVERYIEGSMENIAFYKYFGENNLCEYYEKVKKFFKRAIKTYYENILDGIYSTINDEYAKKISYITEWLKDNEKVINETNSKRIPFDLEKFANINNKTLIIWGTGKGAEDIIDTYKISIKEKDFFVDSNKNKWGKEYLGKLVKSPDDIRQIKSKYILIASSYYKEIIKYIRENNICEDKEIINIFDYISNQV